MTKTIKRNCNKLKSIKPKNIVINEEIEHIRLLEDSNYVEDFNLIVSNDKEETKDAIHVALGFDPSEVM